MHRNRSGAWFGDGELQTLPGGGPRRCGADFVEEVDSFVTHWSGRNGGPPDDDLTAVVVDRR